MVKSGVTTSINTKHQCITAMKEYENKSLEVGQEDLCPPIHPGPVLAILVP